VAHQVHQQAQQGLYEYDAVSRLRDSQLGDARVHDIKNYIVKGRLWKLRVGRAARAAHDEIDKADIEFRTIAARARLHGVLRLRDARAREGAAPPIILITSNKRRSCRMRSCALLLSLHPLSRPGDDARHRRGALPGLKQELLAEALTAFFEVRATPD